MPLRCQLYNGFPPWIKDEISQVGKPDNLTDLHTPAQSINACYWECCSEIACETPANKSQDKPSDKGKTPATPVTLNTNPPPSPVSPVHPRTHWLPLHLTPPSRPLSSLRSSGKMVGSLRKKDNVAWTTTCEECLKATSAATKARAATTEKIPNNSSSAKEPKK